MRRAPQNFSWTKSGRSRESNADLAVRSLTRSFRVQQEVELAIAELVIADQVGAEQAIEDQGRAEQEAVDQTETEEQVTEEEQAVVVDKEQAVVTENDQVVTTEELGGGGRRRGHDARDIGFHRS